MSARNAADTPPPVTRPISARSASQTSSKAKGKIPTSRTVPNLRETSHRLEDRPITLGVCTMAKKSSGGMMTELLERMKAFRAGGLLEFQVVIFDEEAILHEPIEDWPLCDALIAFYSKGFPLAKAQQYAKLRLPLVFNDLEKQELLFDRRRVYQILEDMGVPVPKYVAFDPADIGENDEPVVIDDNDDFLQIGGTRLSKPLVEKPVSGEDHNIYIYYPRSQGGGSKRLFRKVGNRSAEFFPDVSTTRIADGNAYIYEELLQTEGTDVKVSSRDRV